MLANEYLDYRFPVSRLNHELCGLSFFIERRCRISVRAGGLRIVLYHHRSQHLMELNRSLKCPNFPGGSSSSSCKLLIDQRRRDHRRRQFRASDKTLHRLASSEATQNIPELLQLHPQLPRFAFLMKREGDLRSLIDHNMALRIGQGCGPFAEDVATIIMYDVAVGMEYLHLHNIVHRDLKASNVLVTNYRDERGFGYYVADYECSIGVAGTGFIRAPEILQACKDRNVSQRLELFTKEAGVYSYGMMCYEILTGKSPFEGHSFQDYDLVLNGQCPELPDYVGDWARGLLCRCWHPNPAARPSFGDILISIATYSIETVINFRKRRKLILLGFR